MSEIPVLTALVNEVAGIVKERNELREKLAEITTTFGVPQRVIVGSTGDVAVVTGPTRQNRKKLTPSEVAQIREMKRAGETNREIAYCFDINPATVSRIARGIYHR